MANDEWLMANDEGLMTKDEIIGEERRQPFPSFLP